LSKPAEAAFAKAVEAWRAGRLAEAERQFRRAHEGLPDHPAVLHLLGIVLHARGNTAEAVPLLRAAIAANPADPEPANNLGAMLRDLGRIDEAIAAFQSAVRLRPDYAAAVLNLGLAYRLAERWPEAEATTRRALALNRDWPEAWNNLGAVLVRLARPEEALAAFERAATLRPDYADALNNAGVASRELGRPGEALARFDAARAARPDDVRSVANRAAALIDLRRLGAALEAGREAVALAPGLVEARVNLANALREAGRAAEAVLELRRALALAPDNPVIHSNLIVALDHAADDPAQAALGRSEFAERFAKPLRAGWTPHANDRDPGRRLRVGYVSGDFNGHSAALAFSAPVLHHDPEAIEVTLYSSSRLADETTTRFRSACARWRDVASLDDAALATRIRQDSIDLLIDLSSHSRGNRLLAFARKPAPIQISAWGYLSGTGLEAFDGLLSDPTMAPQWLRAHIAETVIDLPSAFGFEPIADAPPTDRNPSPGPVFGNFNRLAKLSPVSLDLMAEALRAVPAARLLLKDRAYDEPELRNFVSAALTARGVAADRVAFLGGGTRAEHLAAYAAIDLAIDTLPQNGGVTSFEALWMGVPVLSLAGRMATGRTTASILAAVGLEDFAVEQAEHFPKMVAMRAAEAERLRALRRELRQRMAASPLADPPAYAKAVEAVYRRLWQGWCARESAAL